MDKSWIYNSIDDLYKGYKLNEIEWSEFIYLSLHFVGASKDEKDIAKSYLYRKYLDRSDYEQLRLF